MSRRLPQPYITGSPEVLPQAPSAAHERVYARLARMPEGEVEDLEALLDVLARRQERAERQALDGGY